MTGTPRVVLLMHPFAGYDRGLLEGIARYAQLHGPWVFCLAGEHRGVPMPQSDSTSDKMFPPAGVRWHGRSEPFSLRRLDAAGVIGRVQTPAIARSLLSSRLPLIAIDLTEKQLAEGNPLSRVSEICADSHRAGRIAAEHFHRARPDALRFLRIRRAALVAAGGAKAFASVFARRGGPSAFTSRPIAIASCPGTANAPR